MNKITTLLSCSILMSTLLFSSCKSDDNKKNDSKPRVASGTLSFNFNGEEVSLKIKDGSVPLGYECDNPDSDYCQIYFEGQTKTHAFVFYLYNIKEGELACSTNNYKQSFDMAIVELKEDGTAGKILLNTNNGRESCKINVKKLWGYKPKEIEPYYGGNLDKLEAEFEMQVPESQFQRAVSITNGRIEASYK
jgi:hypothetical protein